MSWEACLWGTNTQNKPSTLPGQQQVLRGEKCHGVSRRYPWGTKLHKRVCLDPKDLGLASLKAQMHAAVPEIAGLVQKDVECDLLRTLAQTSLLRNVGRTGPQKGLLNLLRPRMCAAHSEGEGERN
jgi:hypothetical protein